MWINRSELWGWEGWGSGTVGWSRKGDADKVSQVSGGESLLHARAGQGLGGRDGETEKVQESATLQSQEPTPTHPRLHAFPLLSHMKYWVQNRYYNWAYHIHLAAEAFVDIKEDPIKGRCLVLNRDIPAGSNLFLMLYNSFIRYYVSVFSFSVRMHTKERRWWWKNPLWKCWRMD